IGRSRHPGPRRWPAAQIQRRSARSSSHFQCRAVLSWLGEQAVKKARHLRKERSMSRSNFAEFQRMQRANERRARLADKRERKRLEREARREAKKAEQEPVSDEQRAK